ncbi:uncharacterized protein [Pleurodeles waltl]|uniref:uncharacterized protein n=1 Tax=Pleurodeles waltl TaxID=8319 RepID=UPI0037094D62
MSTWEPEYRTVVTRQAEKGTRKTLETLLMTAEGKPAVTTSRSARGQKDESEARKAPNSNSGDAREAAWPIQVLHSPGSCLLNADYLSQYPLDAWLYQPLSGGSDCDGPTLSQSDPPYPGGITTPGHFRPRSHPGRDQSCFTSGRRQAEGVSLRRHLDSKGGAGRFSRCQHGSQSPELRDSTDGGGNREVTGDTLNDGRGETSGENLRIGARTTGRIRGTGGAQLKLRPRSGRGWPIQVCGTY